MIDIEIQNPAGFDNIPSHKALQRWVDGALQEHKTDNELNSISLVIRFVDNDEGAQLNHTYRQEQGDEKKATNILSFPAEVEDFGIPELNELNQQESYLGDLVLCEPIVRQEAGAQNKTLESHWAHLIVHGVLHLQGYDHLEDDAAVEMEELEINILKTLGYDNPYDDNVDR